MRAGIRSVSLEARDAAALDAEPPERTVRSALTGTARAWIMKKHPIAECRSLIAESMSLVNLHSFSLA